MPDRDMSEPGKTVGRSAAKKRIAERDAKDPNWRSHHYRDELTETDAVPAKPEDLDPIPGDDDNEIQED